MRLYICIMLVLVLLISGITAQAGEYKDPDWADEAFHLPQQLTSVEETAFEGCGAISKLYISDNITSIGENAFADCANLTDIAIMSDDVAIAAGALGTADEPKTIWGPANSTAEAYAKNYGFSFKKLPQSADALLEYAQSLLGATYVSGSLDCVLFVRKCYLNVFNYKLPDTCRVMYQLDKASVSPSSLTRTKITSINSMEPGDIICWRSDDDSSCSHVGLYMGNGKFIDASRKVGKVRIGSFTDYYTRNFLCAWRVL